MADGADSLNEADILIKQDDGAAGTEVHPQSVPLTPATPDGLSIGMIAQSSEEGDSSEGR